MKLGLIEAFKELHFFRNFDDFRGLLCDYFLSCYDEDQIFLLFFFYREGEDEVAAGHIIHTHTNDLHLFNILYLYLHLYNTNSIFQL